MSDDQLTVQTRVVIVCPWFFQADAVGAAARETYLRLSYDERFDVTALYTLNDYDDVNGRNVATLADLLLDPDFLVADVIIYVFAIYHEFFNAMLVGNGHAKQIVRFHNVTPKRFMPEKHWAVIDKSFVQIQNFRRADEVCADSRENLEELARQHLSGDRIRVVPLAVVPIATAALAEKPTAVIELLYVGRFAVSKGVIDLVRAVKHLKSLTSIPFRLRLVGNMRLSDQDYVSNIEREIKKAGLDDVVEMVGTASNEMLADAFKTSHIYVTASRHEGFCVPVIEALASGCIPVSYPVSNLRYIADGLGKLAAIDTPEALAEALQTVVTSLSSPSMPLSLDRGAMSIAQFDLVAAEYVEGFSPLRFGQNITDRVEALAHDLESRA
jgi:glycosyltransferase involved in cell wall biosynthesis